MARVRAHKTDADEQDSFFVTAEIPYTGFIKKRIAKVFVSFPPQLDRLEEAHRRTSRRMLRQLVEVERSHSGALSRLEEQEEKHRSFIQKSDDLTTLLEQDRERLVVEPTAVPTDNQAALFQLNPKPFSCKQPLSSRAITRISKQTRCGALL